MAYLLDANIFIEASNGYYGFDICPGFWDMLGQAGRVGNVLSIMPVYKEITQQSNQLKNWAQSSRRTIFREIDDTTAASMPQVLAAIMRREPKRGQIPDNFRRERNRFLSGADPFLVAYAFAHKHTIVTHEVKESEKVPSALKIPNVCDDFDVPYIRTEQLVRELQAVFVLESTIGLGS